MANQPQSALDVLTWHQKMVSDGINDAREQVEKQMKLYVIIFTIAFTVAGLLITFAGWLGYKNAVDRAVENVRASITQDVRTKIVNDTAAQLRDGVFRHTVEEIQQVDAERIDVAEGRLNVRLDQNIKLALENVAIHEKRKTP